MQNSESELGSFLAGFVIGALVGAATALILAPHKATTIVSDTRHKAQNLTEQVQDQVRIVLDAGKEQAEQTANNLDIGDATA